MFYSLDVITDGSDSTGCGCLILTVDNPKKNHCYSSSSISASNTTNDVVATSDRSIAARYAFNVPELTTRLCMDQKQKSMSKLRAAFLSANSVECYAGLPGLCLRLSEHMLTPNGELHIVGAESQQLISAVDFISGEILRNRRYPKLVLCGCEYKEGEVKSENKLYDKKLFWQQVYEDEYITVYGRAYEVLSYKDSLFYQTYKMENLNDISSVSMSDKFVGTSLQVVYACTVKGCANSTFIVRPAGAKFEDPYLPSSVALSLDFVVDIGCQPRYDRCDLVNFSSIKRFRLEGFVLKELWDPGQATKFSDKLHHIIPCVFPKGSNCKIEKDEVDNKNIEILSSAQSITISLKSDGNYRCIHTEKPKVYEQNRSEVSNLNDDLCDEIERSWIANFYFGSKSWSCNSDENEIELDEESSTDSHDSNEKFTSSLNDKLFLSVLGSGCAAPSVFRGSSGYAFYMPFFCGISNNLRHRLHTLFETGEGCLTYLRRFAPSNQPFVQHLRSLHLIWISHAHFDHYGGLPTLVAAIFLAGKRVSECSCSIRKHPQKKAKVNIGTSQHQGCECNLHPIIVAPLRVLQYLDCFLNCKNGVTSESNSFGARHRLFFGLRHQDFDTSPFAHEIRRFLFCGRRFEYYSINILRSIPVDHCADAFGLILQFRRKNQNNQALNQTTDVTICFSGDTRPSQKLVFACKDLPISLLIHEATFGNDMSGDALSKRHSTFSEAISVQKGIDPKSCLLTHFSQRYEYGYSFDFDYEADNSCLRTAIALDGMLVPLGCDDSISELFNKIRRISLDCISQL